MKKEIDAFEDIRDSVVLNEIKTLRQEIKVQGKMFEMLINSMYPHKDTCVDINAYREAALKELL